jgi:NAD(P)-dependent dehydrogenase (short-subunit alcohol dehydrogenase family)
MDCLNDQIAVVTGASSGSGKAIALSLAGQGAEAAA